MTTTKKQKTDSETTAPLAGPTLIYDVARPGTLPPANATARPVIVTNRVLMQDPMMVAQTTQSGETGDIPVSPTGPPLAQKVVIKPLEDHESPQTTDTDGDGVIEADDVIDNKPAVKPELELKPVMPNDDQDDILNPDVDKEAAALEADAKLQDEIDGLVEQKTYFLPINAANQRRSRHVFIWGSLVILLLALAWLNIALDAGFITIPGVNSLTHFFNK